MNALVQGTLHEATAEVKNRVVGKIPKGFVILLSIIKEDTEEDLMYLVDRIPDLKIFEDEAGEATLSLKDIQGEILLIPLFSKNESRPFLASPEVTKELVEKMMNLWQEKGIPVASDIFGEQSVVHLTDPSRVYIDSKKKSLVPF